MKLTAQIKEMSLDIDDIASAFTNAFSDEQAALLNKIGKLFAEWENSYYEDRQFIDVIKGLDHQGRRLVYNLANWCRARDLGTKSPHWQGIIDSYPHLDKED